MKITASQIVTYAKMEAAIKTAAQRLDQLDYDAYQAGINIAADLIDAVNDCLKTLPIARED